MKYCARMAGWRSYGQISFRALIATLVLFGYVTANSHSTTRSFFRPGLRNSDTRPVTSNHLEKLLISLRQKTGLMDMKFDSDGFLDIGDPKHVDGGSPTARALILASFESGNCFKLESYYRSPDIAFAQIDLGETSEGRDGIPHWIFELRLDFYDYGGLMGEPEAIASFDPAIGVFHELSHVVLRLKDSISKTDPLGDCERHVNQIRRELGLPERQSYKPVFTRTRLPGNGYDSTKAELTFLTPAKSSRPKKITLFFDVEKVSQDR